MVDWINEDGTFKDGFETNLPEEVRDYARDAKDIVSLIKRGADTKREFHARVKLPTDDEGREKFLGEHFTDYFKTKSKAAEAEAAKQKEEAEATAKEDAQKRLDAAKTLTAEVLGEKPDVSAELCRRAFRGEHCPSWIKDGIAKVLEIEPDKVTDEQFKEVLATDPAVAQTLLAIGNLTKDSRIPTGDGHHKGGDDEKLPLQPKCPEMYRNRPSSDPERRWFENRGFDYETMNWDGKPPV